MRFTTNITRIAHVPPHAQICEWDNCSGYWTINQDGHHLFLRSKDNRIWIPRAFRGKNPGDVSNAEFSTLPKEDSGKASYNLWKEDFDRKNSATKLYDGFEFTDAGKLLVDRFKKFILKSKLDNVAVYSLDPKYSVKPESFDKLLTQSSADRVRSMGRSIAKKYRIATELLRESGKPRIANKFDNDFYYHWNKLEPLFDFDPSKYKPELASPEVDEEEEKSQTETLANIGDRFLEEARNLMDPQMGEFMSALSDFMKVIGKNNIPLAQKSYEVLASILMKYIGRMSQHPVGQAAEQIIQLPSFILLHHKLFEDSSI